jgi:hypothetical protein
VNFLMFAKYRSMCQHSRKKISPFSKKFTPKSTKHRPTGAKFTEIISIPRDIKIYCNLHKSILGKIYEFGATSPNSREQNHSILGR